MSRDRGAPAPETSSQRDHPVVAAARRRAPDERREHVVAVLLDAFGPLIESDPAAFRRRFRRMAAGPWTFYRGSACLFYSDVAAPAADGTGPADRWADERTSRVWIQGDLHAENYGTYMDDQGQLVFDVNDFDEAYLAPFTWDVWRMAASVALLGVAKAFADADIVRMVEAYCRAYTEQVRAFATRDDDSAFALRLDNTTGPVHAALEVARASRRIDLLDLETEVADGPDSTIDRRFRHTPLHRRLDDDERAQVLEAFDRYLQTIPDAKRGQRIEYRVKDVVGRSGIGIGSAGLRTYSLLLEGRTQAMENDVVLSMKQGVVAAPSRVVDDERVRAAFTDHGHRTAVSQRALQAHADPWLGHTQIDGVGYVVSEVSPYTADLDWDGVDEPDQAVALLRDLGRATAKVHCVADSSSDGGEVPFQVEEAVVAVLDAAGPDGDQQFADDAVAFALGYAEVVRDDFRLFVDSFRNGAFPGL
ncbi:DUF2252 domain-containing protein [Streptomyces sp. NP160]|uniref:DUF2252 domain-containing protein n=1 Tax=Streptomyces sp. NP160 TaxID=2586637 RepID=UPI001119DB1E|nr:DUF2252 family protein [Streptomyces sp. NP160]TNM64170.1 DUF2252 domain-containing protein [Streptomyces sp. NP160]